MTDYVWGANLPDFQIWYDVSLGNVLVAGVAGSCESDYAKLQTFFGGATPDDLPFIVFIDAGSFGAYHEGCDNTEIHCGANGNSDPNLVPFELAAEVVEVLSDAIGLGWDCSASTGEGLSRVLATELYQAEIFSFATAASWLDNGRPDWVNQVDGTDSNPISIGCTTLFLNYLHYQLGFAWADIVAAGIPPTTTLSLTYLQLTGSSAAFDPFANLLQRHFPAGRPSGLKNDNPFPLFEVAAATSGGWIIQSDFGAGDHKNFEVVVLESNQLVHYWHDNSYVKLPWARGQVISTQATGAGCIIQSDFHQNGHGNFEVVVLEGNQLVHYWHNNSDVNLPWQRGQVISTQATGAGCIIQSDFHQNGHGNFEVVVLEGNQLVHYWHNNSDVNLPWSRAQVV